MNEENNPDNKEKSSMEFMYQELIRINNELFEIDKLRLDKANKLISFNGAIIAALIIIPFQIFCSSINNVKPIVLCLFIPIIFFYISIHYSLKIYKLRNFATINAKELFNNYWDESKYDLLINVSTILADNINENYYDFGKNKNSLNYQDFLNYSLIFFKWGIILLIIFSFIIIISFLWNFDIKILSIIINFLGCKKI